MISKHSSTDQAILNRPRIIHLTSVHAASNIRIMHKQCKTLAQAGYEVVLIASQETDETVDGIRIRAVTIPSNRWKRMTRTVWHIYRAGMAEKAKLYQLHDPELIPIGLLLKLSGKRVVYDVKEDFPKCILTKPYIPSQVLRRCVAFFVKLIEQFSSVFFDAIIAATPAIARRFPVKKTVTLQNFAILGKPLSSEIHPYAGRPLIVAYTGEITLIRGIKEMVQVMGMLPETPKTRLTLAGAFSPPGLEDEIKQIRGWDRVDFVGWQSLETVGELLGRARIGLVLYHPVPNHIEAEPNKLFEYMAAGIPIVASDFPLWREIVHGARCGILVDPLHPKAIAQAIQWLLEHPKESEAMGSRGLQAARSRFNWNSEAEKLLNLYRTILPATKLYENG